MCGIAGLASSGAALDMAQLVAMGAALRHRGPDDEGAWMHRSGTIGFAHRRLSIIDISAAGHQPMQSASGRFVITFNGEIYNYQPLRRNLETSGCRVAWRGHSDTEVLLAGFEHWGVQRTLQQVEGMFAFALWDESGQKLVLARDRLGEKPLYLGCFGARLAFASEMRALLPATPGSRNLDAGAARSFLRFGYVRGSQSILEGVLRLPPGQVLELPRASLGTLRPDEILRRAEPYWSLRRVARTNHGTPGPSSAREAADTLEQLLRNSVANCMVADVPLGAFLSGGIDSSTVVALMQAQSTRPIRTFSIGFASQRHNEADHAKAVARHLGTDHTEFYLEPGEVIDLIPSMCEIYDEPFADASQLPTTVLARLARQQVTVALSGDGGDELFGGYQRYFTAQSIMRRLGWVPPRWRRMAAESIRRIALPGVANRILPGEMQFRARRFATRAAAPDVDSMRFAFLDHSPPNGPLPRGYGDAAARVREAIPDAITDGLRRQMFADQIDYLPDDILVKLDRATMWFGLESRVPLLDHHIVEFSWTLSSDLLGRHGASKAPLRDVLARYVPNTLFERPKQGFDVPLASWLRGPLRDWAEQLLSKSARLPQLIDAAQLQFIWREHIAGNIDACHHLWNVLMLTSWAEKNL